MANTVQFIDVQLDEKGREKLKAWYASLTDQETLVDELLSEGYKITMSWDTRNQCYSAFLVPSSEKSPNWGMILTARSGNWYRAVVALYYKHKLMLKGDWRPLKKKEAVPVDF